MSEQERKKETEKRIQKLDHEFYKFANVELTQDSLKLNKLHIDYVFNYWKLKRRYRQNKPLLVHKADEDLMNQSEKLLNARIKMFIHLRQDLERVRNLCYMVIKREKLKKKFFQLKTNIFYKQCEFIQKYGSERSGRTKDILSTKHVNCIYDYLYVSQPQQNDTNECLKDDFENDEVFERNEFVDLRQQQQQQPIDDSLTKIKNLEKEIENLKSMNIKKEDNCVFVSEEGHDDSQNLNENEETNNTHSTNLITKSANSNISNSTVNKNKKSISNQIKTKYKNIQINNYMMSQTSTATSNSNSKNEASNNKEEEEEGVDQTTNNKLKRSSTSDCEALADFKDELKYSPNGFSSNNKKLKVVQNSDKCTPTTTPLNNSRSQKMRFSLRSASTKTKTSTSPTLKRSNSRQELNIQNRITRLSLENGTF